MTVPYRIVVDVINVTLIVSLIADIVFAKSVAAKCLALPSPGAALIVSPLWDSLRQIVL